MSDFVKKVTVMLTLIAAAAPAHAQSWRPAWPIAFSLSGGIAYPSGGDLNDTYAAGGYVESGSVLRLSAHLAARVNLELAEFRPAPAPKHVERDSRIGRAESGTLGVVFQPFTGRRADHLYAVLEGGVSDVGATWLDAHNVVEPYFRTRLPTWDFGVGGTVTPRLAFEVRRFTAHRGNRGTVGFIPIGLRLAL